MYSKDIFIIESIKLITNEKDSNGIKDETSKNMQSNILKVKADLIK